MKTVFESLICVLEKGGIQCINHTYQFEKKNIVVLNNGGKTWKSSCYFEKSRSEFVCVEKLGTYQERVRSVSGACQERVRRVMIYHE